MNKLVLRASLTCFVGLLALLIILGTRVQAQIVTVVYSFKGYPDDGAQPFAGLVADKQGNLYGTTAVGGTAGWGTLFRVDSSGNETVLVNFGTGTTAAFPDARLIIDKRGNLYGTTLYGDYGTLFDLDIANRFVILHRFLGEPDGASPQSAPAIDKTGNLYGTTVAGGASNFGTVFKLDSNGAESILHSFGNSPDGAYPGRSDLVMDKFGNLYGTTASGGDSGLGTVFMVDTSGHETVLHSFSGSDGATPLAGLIRDKKGNLYGTTAEGGSSGAGTVFKLDTAGHEMVLYSFKGPPDGIYPTGNLVIGKNGNIYGTTPNGGSSGGGIVFQIDPSGDETVLHNFANVPDGEAPGGGLVIDKKGNLYGTTEGGGAFGFGTVFKLVP